MKKIKSTVALILVLCLVLPVFSSGIAFATSENWVEVTRFTKEGRQSAITDSFTIDYVEWRIVWEFDPGHWHFPTLYTLSVTTYPLGETESYFNQFNEKPNGNLRGVELLNQSGEFYMKIDCGLIDSYTIIVEQNIDSIPEFPSWFILPILIASTLVVMFVRNKLSRKGLE